MRDYDEKFYKRRFNDPISAYRDVFLEILAMFPHIGSAVDIGCGAGGWLAALDQLGIKNFLGVDGPWVPKGLSHIPPEKFMIHDLAESFPVVGRYDLAISLEVAEHFMPERAEAFVAYLTERADIVLFAAAIPKQGGTRHYNEQFPSFWAKLFEQNGFMLLDIMRRKFWAHDTLPVWYKQNLLVAVKKGAQLPQGVTGKETPWDIVHPEMYQLKLTLYEKGCYDAYAKVARLEDDLRKCREQSVEAIPGRNLLLLLVKKIGTRLKRFFAA